MPTITKTKFWNPNPKLNLVFFNNYIETKLKDIQQLHKDKTQTQIFPPQTQNSTQTILGLLRNQTQNSKLKTQINEQNPRSETINNHRFRERELGFWPWVQRERAEFLAKESWVFGQNLEREKAGFLTMNIGNLERQRELGFRPQIQREKAHLQLLKSSRQPWCNLQEHKRRQQKMGHQCGAYPQASDDKVRMRERELECFQLVRIIQLLLYPLPLVGVWYLQVFLLLAIGTTINGGLILSLGNVPGIQCGGNRIS